MTQSIKKRGVSNPESQNVIKLFAIKSKALDVDCYRGFAKLSDLAKISNADEYNEVTHPDGTQRDINKAHARDAYNYALSPKSGEKRIWPEIILNIRNMNGIKIDPKSPIKHMQNMCPVIIKINMAKIECGKTNPTLSRVDGNHRLYYAAGDKSHDAVDITAPFCILDGVTIPEEKWIFRTINASQFRLRTDHIDRLQEQLTSSSRLMHDNPVLWLAIQLREQKTSPFYNLIHIAGPKDRGAPYILKQKSLSDGLKILYRSLDPVHRRPEQLPALSTIILHYFNAVKIKWVNEWNNPKEYLLMTNTGMQALGYVGAHLIKKQILSGQIITIDSFSRELARINFEWKQSKEAENKIPTGRAGGETISTRIIEQLDSSETNLAQLIQEGDKT